jgi:predicted component of type VI protein secretion system
MKKLTIAILGITMLALSACATPNKDITITTAPELDPNLPTQIQTDPVTWHVYTSTDLKNLSKDSSTVLFALSQSDYEKLGKNMVEIQRYVEQLKQTVIYYKNHNASTNTPSN